ncbi:uncharacterized protein LOC134530549 [Bacillus rossius redtenbacheri]|uniref:uncharacterized protein LOC134530549 n=1 Tax=Bacillus rossius redtenbacheri TaxID=93214 RepID=UPI002FDE1565
MGGPRGRATMLRGVYSVFLLVSWCRHCSGFIIPAKDLSYVKIPFFGNAQYEENFANISTTTFKGSIIPGGDLPYIDIPLIENTGYDDNHNSTSVILQGNSTTGECNSTTVCSKSDDTICVRKDAAAAMAGGSLLLALLMYLLRQRLGPAPLPACSASCSPSCRLVCCGGCCDCPWLLVRALLWLCGARNHTRSRGHDRDAAARKPKQKLPVQEELLGCVSAGDASDTPVPQGDKPPVEPDYHEIRDYYILDNSLSYFVVCPVHR